MKAGKFLRILITIPLFAQMTDLELKDLNGEIHSIQSLKGEKLTVIDFWATWCSSCVRSLPVLNDISGRYADRGVGFIGINEDGPRNFSKVRPFIKAMNITFPILADLDQEMASQFQVLSLPSLFILNSQNHIVWSHTGFRPGDEALLMNHLDSLLSSDRD